MMHFEPDNSYRKIQRAKEGRVLIAAIGAALATVISYTTHKSLLWAIFHGVLGWIYVIYFAIFL